MSLCLSYQQSSFEEASSEDIYTARYNEWVFNERKSVGAPPGLQQQAPIGTKSVGHFTGKAHDRGEFPRAQVRRNFASLSPHEGVAFEWGGVDGVLLGCLFTAWMLELSITAFVYSRPLMVVSILFRTEWYCPHLGIYWLSIPPPPTCTVQASVSTYTVHSFNVQIWRLQDPFTASRYDCSNTKSVLRLRRYFVPPLPAWNKIKYPVDVLLAINVCFSDACRL